jgi:hypothetical protein
MQDPVDSVGPLGRRVEHEFEARHGAHRQLLRHQMPQEAVRAIERASGGLLLLVRAQHGEEDRRRLEVRRDAALGQRDETDKLRVLQLPDGGLEDLEDRLLDSL